MYTTNSFKELLLDLSDFKDLPEQWLRNRAQLVPYVARAHQFAVAVAKACYKDRAKAETCDVKEYADCRLSASVLRETWHPIPLPGFTFDPVPCVSVDFEPIGKSLGRFTYDYEPRIGLLTFRFFLTENTFIKVQAEGDEEWGWIQLKSFSLVDKLSGDEKSYYPSSTLVEGNAGCAKNDGLKARLADLERQCRELRNKLKQQESENEVLYYKVNVLGHKYSRACRELEKLRKLTNAYPQPRSEGVSSKLGALTAAALMAELEDPKLGLFLDKLNRLFDEKC